MSSDLPLLAEDDEEALKHHLSAPPESGAVLLRGGLAPGTVGPRHPAFLYE